MRKTYSTGAKWEDIVGYSRAVRVGRIIEVTGTVAVDEDSKLVGKDDAYAQTKYAIQKVIKAVTELGGTKDDIVRTRMFVTDISQWEAYGRAHAEYFKDLKPATTMVEVSKLISPDMMIEMEATAILQKND